MEDALFFMSKASAPRFHQSNGSTARAEPSRRSGNTHGFCVTGGLPPIASEPTPSPRLWTTPPGATPTKLCEHYHRVQKLDPKTGTFYLAGNRNFLFGSDTRRESLVDGSLTPSGKSLDCTAIHRIRVESCRYNAYRRHCASATENATERTMAERSIGCKGKEPAINVIAYPISKLYT